MTQTKTTPPAGDWLAIILIGAGSSFGRDPDKAKAVALAVRHARDFRSVYRTSSPSLKVGVVDMTGFGEWSLEIGNRLRAISNATGKWQDVGQPWEIVAAPTPAFLKPDQPKARRR